MNQSQTDVLAIVAATRPAQTVERIHERLAERRQQQVLPPISISTVRATLTQLREQGAVVRLTGNDASMCGAFPEQYASRTTFWISAEHYRSYNPGMPLPPVHQPAAEPRPPRAKQPTPEATVAAAALSVDEVTVAVLAELDDARASVHRHITRIAIDDPAPDAPENRLARALIELNDALGQGRYAFIRSMTEPAPQSTPVVMPEFISPSEGP